MAVGDTPITLVGNVVSDPELRFTPNGAAVCNFRVASTPRVYDKSTGGYVDGEALFLTVNIWHRAAENVAETLAKGMRVIVDGRLKSRSFQTKNGDNRTVIEVDADEVGPSLKFATAEVIRNPRQDQPVGGGVPGYQQPPPQQQHQGNTWGQPAAPGGPADDEDPPF